ncbi:IclR family transcriptional regulator C-terminal domain-containing protein [Arthrobacter sp. AQ5-05]|uniref:IclR family transcriptional regulator domain-containing protein n=1 Tax=Arthrobacter sp. AQ5-05 TaxID=2184581 RepID=UPI00256FB511|nr:IclR family transcriptional regulator C-terminal domain-containing protein [Arthrobacter sp. AQ5-05]
MDPGYLETDGNRLPVWATSMGRVLVVELPEAAREESLANAQLRNHTSKTVAGIGHLRAELDLVRAQGWSLVAQELDEGLRGLAVPVYRGAQLLGALNVSVQPGRIGSASITEEMLPLMRRTAKNIADDFGGRTAARN